VSGSMISVVSLTISVVRRHIDEPCRCLFAGNRRVKRRSGASEGLVDPPGELVEPRLEDCPFRLGIGDEPVDATA
jgi:hypothetical protein